ncbi:hypothetical protein [Mycobacterium sp. NPDC004974]
MSQPAAPMCPMMLWHGLDDVSRCRFGHSAKHPLAGDGVTDADHVSCYQRPFGREDLGGRFRVEAGDKVGQAARIQQMDGCAGRSQLHGMSSVGGEVDISPSKGVGRQSRDELPEAEPSQDCAESHFDTDRLDAAVVSAREYHVGDSCKPLAGDVDDLCVENISYKPNFVGFQRGITGGVSHRGGVRGEPDRVLLNRRDARPGQQQAATVPSVNEDAVDDDIV